MPDQPAPTDDQIAAARHAGWDLGDPLGPDYPIPPPGGWDTHALDPGPVEVLDGPDEGAPRQVSAP